ncbi:hypothetical protein [Turicibacter sanguinis]|uniref:hypothetical protein n=1 Tax=Turicibacter sanguinis TaxID=154288 RepID=UPI0018A901D8|nr:hypothetical protein [Turicibacter sanguinis]MDB8553239.1 hypothetical protein [Turicibacter sanguinis]
MKRIIIFLICLFPLCACYRQTKEIAVEYYVLEQTTKSDMFEIEDSFYAIIGGKSYLILNDIKYINNESIQNVKEIKISFVWEETNEIIYESVKSYESEPALFEIGRLLKTMSSIEINSTSNSDILVKIEIITSDDLAFKEIHLKLNSKKVYPSTNIGIL